MISSIGLKGFLFSCVHFFCSFSAECAVAQCRFLSCLWVGVVSRIGYTYTCIYSFHCEMRRKNGRSDFFCSSASSLFRFEVLQFALLEQAVFRSPYVAISNYWRSDVLCARCYFSFYPRMDKNNDHGNRHCNTRMKISRKKNDVNTVEDHIINRCDVWTQILKF